MRRARSRAAGIVAGVLIAGMGLAACGGETDDVIVSGTTPTTVTETTLAPTTTAAPTTTTVTVDPVGAEEVNAVWSGRIEVDPETGEVRAPGFNEGIEAHQPEWASSPFETASAVLRIAETEGTVGVSGSAEEDGRAEVQVTISDLRDDSVEAVRYAVVFQEADDGLLRFVSGAWSQRCQPGRGHQDFQAAACV